MPIEPHSRRSARSSRHRIQRGGAERQRYAIPDVPNSGPPATFVMNTAAPLRADHPLLTISATTCIAQQRLKQRRPYMANKEDFDIFIDEVTEHFASHPQHKLALLVAATIDLDTGKVWVAEHALADQAVMHDLQDAMENHHYEEDPEQDECIDPSRSNPH
jgi:hypothetical protein